MHRHAGSQFACQIGGACEQLVRCEVVADQGDPSLDPTARREPLDQGALAIEHLGGRGGERAVLDVPSPHPERCPYPDVAERPADGVAVGDRAGLDHRRDTVAERLDRGQRGGHLVVE